MKRIITTSKSDEFVAKQLRKNATKKLIYDSIPQADREAIKREKARVQKLNSQPSKYMP